MAIETEDAHGAARFQWSVRALRDGVLDWLERFNANHRFASVTWRLIVYNIFGLLFLVGSLFLYSPYGGLLIEARLDALKAQGDIIAKAIADKALDEESQLVITQEFMAPEADSTARTSDRGIAAAQLQIIPEKITPILARMLAEQKIRARVYGSDGALIFDSREQFGRSPAEIAPADTAVGKPEATGHGSIWGQINAWLDRRALPVYRDIGRANGLAYDGVATAMRDGNPSTSLLEDANGQHMVTVAVPIQRIDAVLGVLMLSTEGGQIDKAIREERLQILRIAFYALLCILVSALFLAGTIALPLRRLAETARVVQTSLSRRAELRDYSKRQDDIGHLSSTLRSMTEALHWRIDQSNRFAADVAHELKNPLTSVRNAAEMLPLVKSDADRQRLVDTIRHDVRRLTRLIDDISKATRVGGEMALAESAPVNLAELLRTLTEVFGETLAKHRQKVVLDLDDSAAPGDEAFIVQGHDLRLGQVFSNLIDNALSFSPSDGAVAIKVRRDADMIVVAVEDDGPGIPAEALGKIFDRFYTYRPDVESFGNNSGLGLSISLEIIEAHGGTITAENRVASPAGEGRCVGVAGARLIVRLPALSPAAAHRAVRSRARRR